MTESATSSFFQGLSLECASLVERTSPSVVHVLARPARPSHGIVFDRGLVLTLDHTVEQDREIAVRSHAGRQLEATLAGRDASTNLAVLRVPALEAEPLRPAPQPRPGQLVVAVGRAPDGRSLASVTTIQSTGGRLRTWRGVALDEALRTDGGFGPHFAGAPLVDGLGQIVALVAAGELRAAGVAIPAAYAYSVAATLSREGRVPRGYLGVLCQSVAIPEQQRAGGEATRGLLVVGVSTESAAEHGGLLVGDIVVAFSGQPVHDPEQLHALLRREAAGTRQSLEVIRGRARLTLEVTLGQRT